MGSQSKQLRALWNHPAGPKTIHFWAPLFKWGLAVANIADLSKHPQQLSYPQQSALAVSGLIWARYSTFITPKKWNLFSVSIGTAAIASLQLARKVKYEVASNYEEASSSLAE